MAVGHGRDSVPPGFPHSFNSGLSCSDKRAFDSQKSGIRNPKPCKPLWD